MYRVALVVGVLLISLAGCTEEDPLYCGPNTLCGPGYYCDYPANTCRPTEAGPGGPDMKKTTDGPVPDLGPESDGSRPDGLQADGPKKPKGASCSAGAECASGFCTDGVCCDSACAGTCESCALSSAKGACTPIAAGKDPDKECAGTDPACGGSCNGNGACAYAPETKSCGAASCAAGKLTSKLCDGSGGCTTSNQSCGGYACNTAGDACLASCSSTAQCTGSFQCIGKKCVASLPDGSACGTNNKACASGHCVDGVCCNSSCAGACKSCKVTGKVGTCSNIPSGQDPDKECAGTSAACAGSCNGAGVCDYPGTSVSCKATTCSGSTLSVHKCDGAGTCKASGSSCGRYTCNTGGTACLTSCTADSQCVGGRFCHASKCLSWVMKSPPVATGFHGIWGTTANDIWVVGEKGTIIHFDGKIWSKQASGTTAALQDVWGTGKSDVWAVGDSGTVVHYNGSSWSSSTHGTTRLRTVWGSGSDVWTTGNTPPAALYHFNGTTWSDDSSIFGHALWGNSASDVTLITHQPSGTDVRTFDGQKWSTPQTISSQQLWALFGFASNDIWAVGVGGAVLRYNGSWGSMTPAPPTSNTILAVWGTSPTDVWIAEDGLSAHHFDGTQWKTTSVVGGSIWGNSSTDVWIAGDFLYHLE